MELLQLTITGLSVVAAILAWIAKIRWSKEFADAKEATIAAKDAQIQLLEKQIETYKELSSTKLQEYLVALKTGLEAYIDDLKSQVEKLKAELTEKDTEISNLLPLAGIQHKEELKQAKSEKDSLSQKVMELEAEIARLKPVSEELETTLVDVDKDAFYYFNLKFPILTHEEVSRIAKAALLIGSQLPH